MRYQQPFGVSDTNAPYVNGNPQLGIQGSIPPAPAIEFPQREVVNLIASSNITPADTDLFQLAKGVRSQWMNFAVDTGPTNQMVVAFIPALTAYTPGLPLRIRVLHTNTGAMTLDAGAGPLPVKKMTGADPASGDLPAGAVCEVTFDGTLWQLTNFGGTGGGSIQNFTINIPYIADSGTVNAIIAPYSPAQTVGQMVAGWIGLVKVANSVTGATTLQVNALTAHPVKAPDGSDLLPGDVVAGDVVEFVYDGTNYYIRPNPAISASCTFSVPSTRFPTVAAVMAAITRKTINPTAFVTIQLASGIYSPISIYHKDADQIIVKGTMLTSAPVYGNFSATGSGAGARASDSTNNITMLRTRYGTEIQNTQAQLGNVAQGFSAGIYNLGPGKPVIQDILITGDNTFPGTSAYRLAGIMVTARSIGCRNVATWGETIGFNAINGARIDFLDTCFACGNSISGVSADTGGSIRVNRGIISLGNRYTGVSASGNAVVYVVPPLGGVPVSYASYNGDAGVSAGPQASVFYYGGTALGNANYDLYALINGVIYANVASWGTYSPFPYGTMGNNGSYIGYDTIYPSGPV